MKIILNPEYNFLKSFINEIPKTFDSSGQIVYQGRNKLKLYTLSNTSIVVKQFKTPHIINRFAYRFIRPSKASRSYYHALELLKRDISTPEPIAYIEEYYFGLRHSYYIALKSEENREMREFWFEKKVGNRAFILSAFGEFVAKMHQRQVLHKDLSPGNILFKVKGQTPEFTLVDINRMRFNHSISEKEGYKNLSHLWLPDEAYALIAKAYAEKRGYDPAYATKQILYYKNAFMESSTS